MDVTILISRLYYLSLPLLSLLISPVSAFLSISVLNPSLVGQVQYNWYQTLAVLGSASSATESVADYGGGHQNERLRGTTEEAGFSDPGHP